MATTLDTILYGSQNYRLDTPESDRDYKIVMAPSFSDLYARHELNKQVDDHHSILDVRSFCNGLKKGNPNCIEFLFSKEHDYDKTSTYSDFLTSAQTYYELGYVKEVWPQFVAAVKGMALNGIKRFPTSPKVYARAQWWYNFMSYLHDTTNFRITASCFDAKAVWKGPRLMRERGICTFDNSLFDQYAHPIVESSAAEDFFDPERYCRRLVRELL